MPFKRSEIDDLLAATGRRCCLCGKLHRVQVHHLVPVSEGGSDTIDNAIPLCPNCHDEAHARYSPGRVTRIYTAEELRKHRDQAIERVKRQGHWAPGTPEYEQDKRLVLFYAQCLDRPAFRTHFHHELSYSDFDRAMEDTLLALNTGYWRTRDGELIDRSQGKVHVVNQHWRDQLDGIADILQEIRHRFRHAMGLDEMLYLWHYPGSPPTSKMETALRELGPWNFDHHSPIDRRETRLRTNRTLGDWMDNQRAEAIEKMNSLLREIGHPELKPLEWMRRDPVA